MTTDTSAPRHPRFLGLRITPLTQRRLQRFRGNRRAFWSLWIFLGLFVASLFAEFIANDRPLHIRYQDRSYWPVFNSYSELEFGGDLPIEADYTDPFIVELIEEHGSITWPLVRFSYNTIDRGLGRPAPSPPDSRHWLGTDDNARDVMARLIYGFRISVLFGLALTLITSVVGIAAGAVQGYFGGWLDLLFQRFIEIWEGMPVLYLLIILSAFLAPGFWMLLILMAVFGWTALVGVVRAEFLRARNFDYIRAARALGVSNATIMWRHVLPNAIVATITFLPFILSGSIAALTGLDYLGFGLPPGSPSLGEMIKQAKNNLQAPWLIITAFASVSIMLSLLVFIGEGVRDAFDPRRADRAAAARQQAKARKGAVKAEPAE